jgi:hypothetical protein
VRRAALTALALTLAIPCTAAASTVEVKPNGFGSEPHGGSYPVYEFRYTAGAGETNTVTISTDSAGIHVRDSGAAIQPLTGCHAAGSEVVCPPAAITSKVVELGDGSDSLDMTLDYATVDGGTGNDILSGPNARFDGGPGADAITGSGPSSGVTYAARTAGVKATLDGIANDGEVGEGDNLTGSFRFLIGGEGDDLLSGGGSDPSATGTGPIDLSGNRGNDVLIGTQGADGMFGDAGNDEFHGGQGDDRFTGGPGADTFSGGDGADELSYGNEPTGVNVTLGGGADDGAPGEGDDAHADVENVLGSLHDDFIQGSEADNGLTGSDGDDTVLGEGGNDTLGGGPGFNRIVGGAGRDRVFTLQGDRLELRDGEVDEAVCLQEVLSVDADPFDVVTRCRAHVEFTPAPTVRTGRDGRLRMTIRCVSAAGSPCHGALRVIDRHNRERLGNGPYHLAAGARATVRIKLNAAGRRARRTRFRVPIMTLAHPDGAPESENLYWYDFTRSSWATKPLPKRR